FLTFLNARELSLSEYLSIAMKNNMDIRSSELDIKKAGFEKYQSYGSFLPSSYFSLNFTHNSLAAEQQSAGTSSVKDPSWDRSVSVSLPVFAGGSRFFSVRAARLGEKMEEVKKKLSVQDVKARATAAFMDAYMLQQQIEISRREITLAEENLKRARMFLESGRATELDILNFEMNLEQAKQKFRTHKMDLREKKALLERVAGEEIDAENFVTEKSGRELVQSFKQRSMEEAVSDETEHVLNNSPVIKQMKTALSIADEIGKQAWTSFFPSIVFTYSHDFGKTENHPFRSGYTESSDTVLLGFDINLFNGFQDYMEVRKKDIDELNAELALKDMKDEQRYVVKQILTSVYSLEEQRRTVKKTLELTKRTLEKTQLQYKLGASTYLDVLSAQNNYIQSEKQLVIIDATLLNSIYQLRYLSGEGE
ncbi:MAG: TolC family protein, partial [bacterium]